MHTIGKWDTRRGAGVFLLFLLAVPLSASAADLSKARSLLMRGRYEEAAEIYKQESAASAPAVLGLAACLESQGKTATAVEALAPLADRESEIQAQLARLAFQRRGGPRGHFRARTPRTN